MLQNATPLRKSAPWPPNISDGNVSCTAPAMRNPSLQILFICPMPAIVIENDTKPTRLAQFGKRCKIHRACHENDSWTSKSGHKVLFFFTILTSKRALRHRLRALFEQPNFQNRSETEVLLPFWLRDVLRAAATCTFWTAKLPKALPKWGVFHILASRCSACHKATRPQGHAISLIWPDGSVPPLERAYFSTISRLFYLFAHFELLSSSSLSLLWFLLLLLLLLLLLCLSLICLSSSLTLSLLTLSLLWLFSPLLLHRSSVHKSEVWLLNFLR